LDNLYKQQSLIFKYLLYVVAVAFIVFFLPKGGKFKYEFQKGKPWQFENLYAPFDFSIQKTDAEIAKEKQIIESNQLPYYKYDKVEVDKVVELFEKKFEDKWGNTELRDRQKKRLKYFSKFILDSVYAKGILQNNGKQVQSNFIFLVKDNEASKVRVSDFFSVSEINNLVGQVLAENNLSIFEKETQELFVDIITPNVSFDSKLTHKARNEALSKLSYTRGTVDQGRLIIAKGEVVEAENLKILESLKSEYESELWTASNYYYFLIGYTVLVALVLIILFLFLKKYRRTVYNNNVKVTFIFFNILLMVFITTMIIKHNDRLVFVVPLCILPLILKTFFDARLGLFVHVLTILILGFVVPNSFEYIFLQIITGIVTILTVSELYKRANLFVSVGQITLIYIIGYLAFHTIHEGNLSDIEWYTLGLFLLNGMITLFVQPLIYIYEKVFGLVSDVSLLELSDTNSKLLKELSNKAPGTFHHSLQVANLAEAAANEIGANAMLVRVGALYHDIGKMNEPTYFTENQVTNVNPHDELSPKDSARIIIDHVIKGIEIARKNNIPDRIIDFIRSHHGTTLVFYFYKKQKEQDVEMNEEDFRYPGPLPFSRETAILMMADSVEAASKSLKNPTFLIIDDFVDKIISGQMKANQFLNADITFKEIEIIKKIFKQKLINIYHLRVEYPE